MCRTLIIVVLCITTCYACDTYSTGSSSTWSPPPYRSNITENQPGAPLTIVITMINRTICMQGGGVAMGLMNDVEVDIWHVNAACSYSSNSTNTTYLRGYQITNTTGSVSFQTIYPGYEQVRTVYVNVHVGVLMGDMIYQDETQIFFDDSISNSIYAQFPSYSYGTRSIYNNNDTLYSDNMEVSVIGDSIHGYTAYVDLYYPFISTTTSTNGTWSNTTVATDMPSNTTTLAPTDMPTNTTDVPTDAPTDVPTDMPTDAPTDMPTNTTTTTDMPTTTPTTTIVNTTTNAPTTASTNSTTPTTTPTPSSVPTVPTTSDTPTSSPNTTLTNTTTPTPTSTPKVTPNTGVMLMISPITILFCSVIMMF